VEAGWTNERRRGPELDATFRRPTCRYKVVQLVPEWIGNMGAASQGGWHAEFVTDTTSDAARGAAVCRPDAIIPFKPVRPTGFVLCLAGLYIQSLETGTTALASSPQESGLSAPASVIAG
jgi:hypothetical protein